MLQSSIEICSNQALKGRANDFCKTSLCFGTYILSKSCTAIINFHFVLLIPARYIDTSWYIIKLCFFSSTPNLIHVLAYQHELLFLLTIFSPTLGFFCLQFLQTQGSPAPSQVGFKLWNRPPQISSPPTPSDVLEVNFFGRCDGCVLKCGTKPPPKKKVPKVVPLFSIADPCPQDVCQISSWRFFSFTLKLEYVLQLQSPNSL